MNFSDHISLYRSLGFSIIPVIWGTKKAATEWKEFQYACPGDDQIKSWFSESDKFNVAVVCGIASENLVVLDFDDVQVYEKFFDAKKIESQTIVVRTGGGKRHVYLRSPVPILSFRIPQLKLEVRSTGNIVVAPPSIHPSGSPYTFVNPDVKTVVEVADIEKEIWSRAKELGVPEPPNFVWDFEAANIAPYRGGDPPCIKKLLPGVDAGQRNESAIRLASYLMRFCGKSAKVALERLKFWNQRNRPPLPEREIEAVVKNIDKVGYKYGCHSMLAYCDSENCPLAPKKEAKKHVKESSKLDKSRMEEISKKALELAHDPALLFKIGKAYEQGVKIDRYRCILGEDENKRFTTLVCFSAKTPYPQFEWITGDPGVGKTNQVKVVVHFFPKGYVKERGYITRGGLRYGDQDYKVLYLQEFRAAVEQDIRLLSKEDGGFAFEIAVKDPETQEWTTIVEEVPAKVFITTSAENLPTPQLMRRCFLVSPDTSMELTRKIIRRKIEHAMGLVAPLSEEEVEIWRAMFDLIEPDEVIIPFAEELEKLANWTRWGIDGIIDLISIIACLYEKQRPRDDKGRIIAQPADLYMAIRMGWKVLGETIGQLPDRLKRVLEKLAELKEATTKDMAKASGLSQSSVRVYLNDLINLGFVYESRPEGQRSKVYTPSDASVNVLCDVKKWINALDWRFCQNKAELASDGKCCITTVIDPVAGEGIDLLKGPIPCNEMQHMPNKEANALFSEKEAEQALSPSYNTMQHYNTSLESRVLRVLSERAYSEGELKERLKTDDEPLKQALGRLFERGEIARQPWLGGFVWAIAPVGGKMTSTCEKGKGGDNR